MAIVQLILSYGYYVIGAAIALAALAWILVAIAAFRTRLRWGVVVLLFPPAALLFMFAYPKRCIVPLGIFAVCVLGLAATSATHYAHNVDLGPREKIVNDELHLTLTGWDRNDYVILAAKPDTVVLQMANPDVTDQTIDLLSRMKKLRELDINTAHISDDALRKLRQIPTLRVLNMEETPITDEGFRQHLLEADNLLRLDVFGTSVKEETLREWMGRRPKGERWCHPRPKGLK